MHRCLSVVLYIYTFIIVMRVLICDMLHATYLYLFVDFFYIIVLYVRFSTEDIPYIYTYVCIYFVYRKKARKAEILNCKIKLLFRKMIGFYSKQKHQDLAMI